MVQYLTIPVDDVFAAAGTVQHEHPADTRLKPARPWDAVTSYGLLLSWPKAEAWLTVDAVARATPTAQPVPFAGTKEAVDAVCRAHAVDPARVAPVGFLAAAEVRVASVTNTTAVTLRLTIDTDHESFLAAVRDRVPDGKSELVQPVGVRLFDSKSLGAHFEQAGVIQLILRPARPVPAYFGVVALDLGNTSSDLAAVSRRDAVYRTSSLRLLDAESAPPTLAEQASALASAVRVDRVVSATDPPAGTRRFPDLPGDDGPKAVEYAAGRAASAPAGGLTQGLVLGAKRLVSGGNADGVRAVVARHRRGADGPEAEEEIEVRNRVPAELLATRLLERFRTAAKAWPAELAVTYPTTYTPRELAKLCRAVERGWLRMLGRPQEPGAGDPPDDPEQARLVAATQARLTVGGDAAGSDPGVVRLKLDEATAAAFFFLYRKVFESPGGLLRFRYLYPDGLTLLLYDCGGGTTDIALVRATAVGPRHLRVGVLGRTGLRGFGGDDITRAVARLLKAKVLAELAKVRGKAAPPPPPRSPDPTAARTAVESFLRKCRDLDPADQWVPTRFARDRFDTDTRERRRHALELWALAEQLKADLGRTGSVKFDGFPPGSDTLADAVVRGLTDAQTKAAAAQLKTVQLHRWEVEALVDGPEAGGGPAGRGPVTRSVEKCNRLIQTVLRDRRAAAGLPEEEVQWVVVSGNASRYPLIRERLVEQLQVADVAERLTLDEANLKHAVAKGAAMFLVTTRTPGLQVIVDTEADLSSVLPFDVGYYDAARGKHVLLYREHERYADLAPARVPVPPHEPAAGPEEAATVFLERRFPGDDEFGRFLAFAFRDGVRGELEVTYDPAGHEFGLVDTATGAVGEPRDLTDGDVYVAPAERGDI